ncbi:MAG TPA: hypothetical protein VHE55_05010 [Fimbriimonadaceae bacterium]|nr:hypothetical protein [Fimbriimonadaceae bacterium]
MHRITKSLVSLVVVTSVFAPAIAAKGHRDGTHPVILAINPTSVRSGGTMLCTVTLDNTTDGDLSVNISPSDGSLFSSIPSSVTVSSGDDHVTFYATLTSSASGAFSMAASANGGYAFSPMEAISP